MKETRKFPCRIEELPVLAGYLRTSFIRDQADFASFSPNFDSRFLSSYESILEQVEGLGNVAVLKSDQKMITSRMHLNIEKLRPLLLIIEGYVKHSQSLKASLEDFGFARLRNAIRVKNIEGVLFSTRTLLQKIDSKIATLADEGFREEHRTALANLMLAIEEDDLAQAQKISRAVEQVYENIKVMNVLWDKMSDLMDTGKRLYKYKQTAKLDDYTLTSLRKHRRSNANRKSKAVEEEVA